MLRITPQIAIGEHELEFHFISASGPGGQNVNKVAAAVQLRFDATGSPSLSDDVRLRLRQIAGRRMTADGVVIIKAQRFRSQDRNREDATDRLVELLRRAASVSRPRRPTGPTPASRERRLAAKARRSTAKRLRGQVADEER